MNKTEYTFLVFGTVYFIIAICTSINLFCVNSNVLLGLSLTSLFISIEDITRKSISIKLWRNLYEYTLYIASDYITQQIENGVTPNANIDLYNIRMNINNNRINTEVIPEHPSRYQSKRFLRILNRISNGSFIFSIASFIILPFLEIDSDISKVSQIITLFAFSFICIGIFLGDYQQKIANSRASFENNDNLIIDASFPGYMNYYVFRTNHYESYSVQMQLEEKKKHDDSSQHDAPSEIPEGSILDRLRKQEDRRQ